MFNKITSGLSNSTIPHGLTMPEIGLRGLELPQEPKKEPLEAVGPREKDLSPAHYSALARGMKAELGKYETTKELQVIAKDFSVEFKQPGLYFTDAVLSKTFQSPKEVLFNARDVVKCYRAIDAEKSGLSEEKKIELLTQKFLPVYAAELKRGSLQLEAAKAAGLPVVPATMEDNALALRQEMITRKELQKAGKDLSIGQKPIDEHRQDLDAFYEKEGVFGLMQYSAKTNRVQISIVAYSPEEYKRRTIAPTERGLAKAFADEAQVRKELTETKDVEKRKELEERLENIPVLGLKRTEAGMPHVKALVDNPQKYEAVQKFYSEKLIEARKKE